MADRVAEDDRTGQVLGGRYRLRRLVGEGGMGSVYEAVDQQLERRVAVKLLRASRAASAEMQSRFRREALAAARLGHANIVQVTDLVFGPDEPTAMVMEYLEGRTLGQVIQAEGPLPDRRVAVIAVQVLSALETTHAAGIIHRDLKPANIFMVSMAGVDDVVKLLDFGIAKLVAEPATTMLTQPGSTIGTPAFMAPEQVRGDEVTPACDIYGAGAVMYAALAGRAPFSGRTGNALLAAVLEADPEPLVRLRRDLDPALADIVHTAMAKEPGRRFASATEMRRALEQAAGISLPTTRAGGVLASAGLPTPSTVAAAPGARAKETRQEPAGARVETPSTVAAVPGARAREAREAEAPAAEPRTAPAYGRLPWIAAIAASVAVTSVVMAIVLSDRGDVDGREEPRAPTARSEVPPVQPVQVGTDAVPPATQPTDDEAAPELQARRPTGGGTPAATANQPERHPAPDETTAVAGRVAVLSGASGGPGYGSFDWEAIRGSFRPLASRASQCGTRFIPASAPPRQTRQYRAHVDGAGHVVRVEAQGPPNEELDACMIPLVRTLRFSPPASAQPSHIGLRLVFELRSR